MLSDFFRLLFPNRCEACGTNLVRGERILCLHCQQQLPKTHYWQQKDNVVEQMFWGRVPIVAACSFFHFSKGSKYRKLLHKLKYKHLPQIGVVLGQLFGTELAASPYFADIDVIVPIPLHPKRQRNRGYNQSERIGYGLSQSMGIPLYEKAIVRERYNETQTKKNREERLQNVQNIFAAGQAAQQLQGKHVLIVDDVLTTGATLEVCIQTLLQSVDCRVSVATLAAGKA
ncbi:amidophosphoribosyltransferase [Bacteroidia bacterium]|nr:amidophosphoribosyltransferase [Bacteroidia bacterium]GHT82180.1 amidophosphoribosyltransferase [Bacteroidia bacterium]